MNQAAAATIDQTMQRASEALARMDYIECESLCLRALAAAREAGDWADYARILMPLQESRRQRRMIAAEGVVRLGSTSLAGGLETWLSHVDAGCIVVTQPHGRHDALRLHEAARAAGKHVEVLLADCDPSAPKWTLRTFTGPDVTCDIDAPPAPWVDTDEPGDAAEAHWPTPADWFLDASERLGDAALAAVAPQSTGPARVAAIEACLDATADHEILHQRLYDAARAIR